MYFHNLIGTGSYITSTTNMYNKYFTYPFFTWRRQGTAIFPAWETSVSTTRLVWTIHCHNLAEKNKHSWKTKLEKNHQTYHRFWSQSDQVRLLSMRFWVRRCCPWPSREWRTRWRWRWGRWRIPTRNPRPTLECLTVCLWLKMILLSGSEPKLFRQEVFRMFLIVRELVKARKKYRKRRKKYVSGISPMPRTLRRSLFSFFIIPHQVHVKQQSRLHTTHPPRDRKRDVPACCTPNVMLVQGSEAFHTGLSALRTLHEVRTDMSSVTVPSKASTRSPICTRTKASVSPPEKIKVRSCWEHG